MPNITNLGLYSTTVNAISGQSGTFPATWRDTTAASYEQGLSVTALTRESSAKNMRNTYRVRKPIIRSIDGVDTVIAVATATIDYTFPKVTTSAERDALNADVIALVSQPDVVSSVIDLAPHY